MTGINQLSLRNDVAHSSGTIRIRDDNFENEIRKIFDRIKEIQTYSQKLLLETFEYFLLNSYDEDTLSYDSFENEIRENFISKYSLSIVDIRFLRRKFDVYQFKDNENFPKIKVLFGKFKALNPD
jgi:hypothetical protein